MVKRICPKCGKVWYSSDTRDIDWRCDRSCGATIPKSQERLLDKTDLQ